MKKIGITEECYELFWTNPEKQHPTKLYGHFPPISQIIHVISNVLLPLNTPDCPTSKDLHTSGRCRYRLLSRGPAGSDEWWDGKSDSGDFVLSAHLGYDMYIHIYVCACLFDFSHGVMVKALEYGIVVSEFELQSRYYVHFRTNTLAKGMNPAYPPDSVLNSTTTVFLEGWIGL